MKSDELIPGKKYLIMERYIGEFVANDGRNIYFKIENPQPLWPQPGDAIYPGTVGFRDLGGYEFKEIE